MRLSNRLRNLPERKLGEIHDIVSSKRGIINFGPGWPDFDIPPKLRSHLIRLSHEKGIAEYGSIEGTEDLREAIAKKLKQDNNIKTSPENILITTGSTEGILLAIMGVMDTGDNVILQDPCYIAYEPAVRLLGGSAVRFPLHEEDGWQMRCGELGKVADSRTRAIIINTPSNPTGVVLNRGCLEEIADTLIEKNIVAIVDEAYEKFVYGKKHFSLASLNGLEKHVITLGTFSKEFAIPGFRIGYTVADKKFVDAAKEMKLATTLCTPKISQALAVLALKERGFTKKMVSEFKKRRDLIYSRLCEANLPCVKPEGAFYAFVNIKHTKMSSMRFVKYMLDKAKVAVIPGSDFGKHGEGYVRFSFATKRNKINEGMDRLEREMRKLKLDHVEPPKGIPHVCPMPRSQ